MRCSLAQDFQSGTFDERLTNKKLISTTHKVINPKDASENNSRYSMPFFIHLNPDFYIETIDSCIDHNNPNLFPEGISADDFLNFVGCMRVMELVFQGSLDFPDNFDKCYQNGCEI